MLKKPRTTSSNAGASKSPPQHSTIGPQGFAEMARESLRVAGHLQLMLWLQGEFQQSIPHQIFIAAWGDLSKGLMRYDLVSAIPSVRTDNITIQDISQLIGDLFDKWVEFGATPIGAQFEGGLRIGGGDKAREELKKAREELKAFRAMQSAMVHGIRDARGEQDCLYVFLSADPVVAPPSLENLRVMLPFIDAASRRVANLPSEVEDGNMAEATARTALTDFGLSGRELEIMHWVKQGKTNPEIGMILDVSTFTVKNHLQRIYRKLDVSNRAQAVSKVQSLSEPSGEASVTGILRNDSPRIATARATSEES